MFGSPVLENAAAPAFMAARNRVRETAADDDCASTGPRATSSPVSSRSNPIVT
jgi:hypothetical protein